MTRLAWLALADFALLLAQLGTDIPGRLTTGAGHLMLCLAVVVLARQQMSVPTGWDRLAVPLGLAGGPAVVLLLAWLRPWAAFRLTPATALDAEEKGEDAVVVPAIIARIADQRVRFPPAERLQSLATVLRHGDLQSRCNALQTVVRSFEPKLSPLITAALRDPDQTVRALAAATSAQVSANVARKLAAFDAAIPATPTARFDAAMALFDHATNNVLLSQAQRLTLRTSASRALHRLSANPDFPTRLRAPVAAALVRLDSVPRASAPLNRPRAAVARLPARDAVA